MVLFGIIKFVFLFRSFSVSRLHLPEKQQCNTTVILKNSGFFAVKPFVRLLLYTKIKAHNTLYKQTLIITTLYTYIYVDTIIHNLILLLN